MALNVKGRKVGCSYYDGHLLKLFVLQDMAECNVVDMIETVKAQVRPTLILVSTRMDEDILSVLRFEETGQETKVEIRPSSDFSYATAKSKVIAVTINAQRSRHDSASRGPHHTMARPHCSEMDDCVQKDAQLRLSIDLQSTESVGCAGAVISFLSRYVVSRSSVRVASSLMIVAIESFTMESFMFINPNSLSLKIYNSSQELLVGESPIIQQIKQQFIVKDLMDIGAYINDVVDFDESIIEGRCVVKYNVDEELDRMRQTYHGLDSFLSEIAKDISQTIPSDFTSTINVIYFPQLGYLITVPMNPSWKTDQDFHLEGLSYQSIVELDEHLGDIHGLIVDREIDILQGLQERILEYAQLLVICSDLCAELDVHPLQELVVDSFVTNDTLLGDAETPSSVAAIASSIGKTGDQQLSDPAVEEPQVERLQHDNEVMILSGPNSSGKSVYLKQVALITYMAHVGSFVPATTAVIGLTDKILTRVQTRETVSSIQSSFMTDLQQVVLALKMATKRSLVVLDEFGKGTTSIDGAGMFCGVIEYFARMEHDRPRVLATTHFHELFENHMLDLSLPLSLYTMEVYQEPGRLEATFLFRVIPGKTPSSLGPACAAMASMPLHIVQRGTFLSRIFQRYEMVVPMLTEHELEMQKMYKQLVDMLLSLDLDGYLGDSAQEESKSGSTSDQHTSPFNIGGRGSNRVSNSVEGHNQDAFEGASSDWSEKAIHGKRKRSDPEEGKCIDTEKLDTDVLDRSIKELIEYAVKVSQKEREGMQEE
ncbi:MutS protein msh5 [Mortierella sp. GBA43]|nr:MutS protein msh5 [Mortierella sp. GBA43]